ncbi:polysaccharide deacetylase family protein [Geomonas subterranea]|uniref:Polysaccharide deacetylase n=1 Tax=Geomonas subterranea TaxID=2847989 RepID=A0ABX8LBI4_9BACT|nr:MULTISPECIES: polysaccharide deacetylase [Geomonas]QXE89377.1 polysaccharide deacetylase [Geomonas subterranea]QXM08507.1 polysaccharide deacetylase [Geomonas subterranea]
MRLFYSLLLILPLLIAAPDAAHAQKITGYRSLREPVADRSGRRLWAIRSFNEEGVPHRLVVDPATLQSFDLPAAELVPRAEGEGGFWGTRLGRAVKRYTAPPYRLQNGGATRAETAAGGFFLTVDLCPSKRPFERELFETAAALSPGKAVPVAVMVTGLWLESHPEEVAYLKGEVAAGRLAVTWVNHSWHHHYDPKVPLAGNFLLAPGTDLRSEVLQLEQELLARGLVPSPFFRFPGLVSDGATMNLLAELSLVPVGADAWLAKGEQPRRGSFILVHGNGNEPKGIRLALPLLKGTEVRLLPLPAAFAD